MNIMLNMSDIVLTSWMVIM